MNLEKSLSAVSGAWTGSNLKRMSPEDQYTETPATAVVSVVAQGNAATFGYTWAEDGSPQDGVLLMTNGKQLGSVAAVWVDSWHQAPQWMNLDGGVDDDGVIRLEASYEGASWRITVDPSGGDQLRLAMDNIYGGMDYQVVEATYRRSR